MIKSRFFLIATAMLVGITTAFAINNNDDCPWPLYYRIAGGGPFVGQGTIASEQNPSSYATVEQGGYSCIIHFITCTYYLDPVDGEFKQCNEGEYVAN